MLPREGSGRDGWFAAQAAASSLPTSCLLCRHWGTLDLSAARRRHQKRAAEASQRLRQRGIGAGTSAVGAEAALCGLHMHDTDLAPVVRALLTCAGCGMSRALMVVSVVLLERRGGVGALRGGGVSADAQAYFGTRPGVVPGRRHDV